MNIIICGIYSKRTNQRPTISHVSIKETTLIPPHDQATRYDSRGAALVPSGF